MIYVVISRENDGHYYDETFTNEKLAIQKYECDRNRTFCGKPIFNSVQLFILCNTSRLYRKNHNITIKIRK